MKQVAEVQPTVQDYLHWGVYGLLVVTLIGAGGFILAFDDVVLSPDSVALEEGGVAPADILSPRSLQYESEVLTKAKRDAEIAAVRPVYDPPDRSVLSEQLQLARQILDYIDNVRHDDFATLDQKLADVNAITALSLEPSIAEAMLTVPDDERWGAIDAQVVRLLERVMSGEVREDNLQARRESLTTLISSSYSESEAQIIQALVGDLIRPNTFFNEELTRQAQEEAGQGVAPEIRSFARGQMIIRAGEIATPAHIEALDKFGLLEASDRRSTQLLSSVVVMGLVVLLLGLYIWQFCPELLGNLSMLLLLGGALLLFLAGAQFVGANGDVRHYYYPASAFAFLIATIIGKQFAIVMAIMLATLVGYMANDTLEFATLIGFGSVLGVLSLGRTERFNAYFLAGGVVSVANVIVALLFAFSGNQSQNLVILASQLLGGLINGLFSAALALVGLYLVTNLMNIPTSLKLVELMQPNHPLLVRLLREAPGTYQHSLQVANLAELGAQQIDANASLLRVAAMYHDIGKILNPHFFVENQASGVNPHDALGDPYKSARIIIGHVTEGDRLARRHHLPVRIRDFILEHHGTSQVAYFYHQANQAANKGEHSASAADFSYPGPRPQSRETAILMLADGCESSVRARRPQSKLDIQETVDYIFETRLREGQLDDSGLTLNDLRVLRETFLTALQGVFHPRIAYPGSPGEKQPSALPVGDVSALPGGEQSARVGAGALVDEGAGAQAASHRSGIGAVIARGLSDTAGIEDKPAKPAANNVERSAQQR